MAINNPSNLYSAGNVVLNSQPEVNLYAQLMAKRQAKNEAIDEYYRKLPSTLNSAGMRDQDRAGFDQKIAKTQQYWMQNKDKIRKGNSQEAFNYEQMFRELGTDAERSKGAGKTDLELGKMRFSKENGYIFEDPDFMDAQQKHSLSIYDQAHKELDLGTVTIPTKPLDAEGKDKLWGIATKGIDPGKVYRYEKKYTNPQTGQVIVPFEKIHSERQIVPIAENYANSIKGNKSAIRYYNDILENADEETINQLQEAYSSKYPGITMRGKNGTFVVRDQMDTPEKVAKAEAIIRASVPKEIGEEQESNYQQKQQASINKIYLQDSLIKGRQKGSESATELVQYDVLETYKGKQQNIKTIKGGGPDNYDVVLSKDVDVKDQELIGVTPYKQGKLSYYKVRPDGDWEGSGGQVISWAKVAKANLDKTTANEVKRGATLLTADKAKSGTTKPTGKTDKDKPVTNSLNATNRRGN